MDENHEVNQTAAWGSHHNTFAGMVNNYGLSVTDVTRMALQMFREYYPQLQKEALDTVQKLVEEHLKLIPAENIIPPKANVVVPVLQNASLTEEPDLLKMYATVLANSMDKFMQSGIHPGFVDVIRQLSSDEAKILKYMNQHPTVPTVTLRATDENRAGFSVVKNFSNVGELTGCEVPYNTGFYFDNLQRLGLVSNGGNMVVLSDESLYEPLENNKYMHDKMNNIRQQQTYNRPLLMAGFFELSDYGKAFCKACMTIQIHTVITAES